MKLSIKSIALATMMTVSTISVSTGLALSGSISAASAQTNSRQMNQQLQFQPQLCTKASITGNWKGMIVPTSDDIVIHLEMNISPGTAPQQGTWKFVGASGTLNQGTVKASVQGNAVTLELWKSQLQNNLTIIKKIGTMQGNFQDCGSKISGNGVIDNRNFTFSLSKF
ncbi:hypothetical protein PN465_18320 [Nodularia spumigena CS-584]|jgi:hypothetical protein|uniref:Uncharacterized protein n=2 Tax=Nodularia spumigena TaxID=70799 RepID=A0A166KB34_NODSP|nr:MULTISPECIES: hypothetical protein [Cyanophyceae]MDB9354743.1 hypothetical protein [Nodularia spumigena CS-587/03]AHJ30760.1 hypothetical protein NSP_44630 [Nodularia spumigena CCY9414]EAW44206.1 hypothetical protein N9414_07449 [Nodularia spumigena CCY9414]KZL50846.1 hypothetical protein A2T98_05530 [Nodularia spumigena CENA596]MDB9306693.1 hypothetical protein [Nodularia spumigena CS-591/12]